MKRFKKHCHNNSQSTLKNNLMLFSMEECARDTNIRASRAFVGEATYRDQFTDPFSIKEIRQFLGLYVLNGLSPSPSLEKKFDSNGMVNFNPFVHANIGGAVG